MKKKSVKRKDFEIRFYERLVKERPSFLQALVSLGNAYTRKGFYEEGLAVDKKLVELKPDDPIAHYNLACSLSLLGKAEEAFLELKKAVLLGYEDFDYLLKDPDLENVRRLNSFKDFLAKLEKIKRN